MNIQEVLENNGFDVSKESEGFAIQQYTPEGEDWYLYFDKLEDVVNYAEDYCPDEDFEMWLEARHNGVRGVPAIPELWKDQLWKKDILTKVAQEIRTISNE